MSAAAHEHAVASLERSLAHTHPLDGGLLDYRRAVVTALVELGVLDLHERDQWNARFWRVSQPPDAPDQQLHDRAVKLLERELIRAAEPPHEGDPLGPRERFTTKLQALLESAIIGWKEKSGFVEQLDQVAPAPPPTSQPPPRYRLGRLRAVTVGPNHRIDGLRICSVELYGDCTLIRWHLVIDPDPTWREQVAVPDRANDLTAAHAPASLADDLGTAYTLEPFASLTMPDVMHLKQRPQVLRGTSAFTPAVPPQATQLAVQLPTGEVEIDLPASP